jgi:tetrathionate reductase subunit B
MIQASAERRLVFPPTAQRASIPGIAPSHIPPPQWTQSLCAAGEPGLEGCRRCVETCPYSAISTRDSPGGTRITIDAEACRRCGACTSVCPTSALQRQFLPDSEIRARVVQAVGAARPGAVLVYACDSTFAAHKRSLPPESAAWVVLPSILLLNETHLLFALRAGAGGILVAGCPDCHHGSPSLLDQPLRLALAFAGSDSPVAYVEDDRNGALLEAHRKFPAKERPAPGRMPEIPEPRRVALLSLLGPSFEPVEDPRIPFADVTVSDVACTLCGACADVCPTGALEHDGSASNLSFLPAECVNCGLCAQGCPESAVTLIPGLRDPEGFRRRREVVKDSPAPCARCRRPFAAERLVRRARNLVSDAGNPAAAAQVGLCPSCRDVRPAAPAIPKVDRRVFLKTAATAAVSSVGALRSAAFEPPQANGKKRLGMVIDIRRCTGCHACTAACKAENDVPLGVYRDWVEEHVQGDYPHAVPLFVPKLCNHCDDPGCLRACPTGAISKRPDGIVDLDHGLCIGCRACNQACPYGAAFMDPVRGTSDKCNLCAHRVDEGLRPACVDVCPPQCRVFGDLDDPESAPSKAMRESPSSVLRPELGLGPNIVYLGLPGDLNR